MDIFCAHCVGVELEQIVYDGTYIHVCPECPNVTFEYVTEKDLNNLREYLNQKK